MLVFIDFCNLDQHYIILIHLSSTNITPRETTTRPILAVSMRGDYLVSGQVCNKHPGANKIG